MAGQPWLKYQAQAEPAGQPWLRFAAPEPKTSPQDLQAAMQAGDPAAKAEWDARNAAAMGDGNQPYSAASPDWFGQDGGFFPSMWQGARDTTIGVGQSVAEGGTLGQMVNLAKPALQNIGINLPTNPIADKLRETVAANRVQDVGLNESGGNLAGNIVGNVALMNPAFKATQLPAAATRLAKYGAATATGGALGYLQPHLNAEEQAKNTAVSAAIGVPAQMAGSALSSLASGGSGALNATQRAVYEAAKRLKIPVTMEQLTDSSFVKSIIDATKSAPFSGAGEMARKQISSYTRAAAKRLGLNTDELSPSALEQVSTRVSGMYNRIFKNQKITVDSQANKELKDLWDRLPDTLSKEQRDNFSHFVGRIQKSKTNGSLPGELYQNFREQMKKIEAGDNGYYGTAMRDFRKIYEKMAERSVPQFKSQLEKANALYRDKKLIEKAMEGADTSLVKTATRGELNPNTLKKFEGKKYGLSDPMQELADVGQMIKPKAIHPESTKWYSYLGTPAAKFLNSEAAGRYTAEGLGPRAIKAAEAANPIIRNIANSFSTGQPAATQSQEIIKAANENPDRGPEILSNLPQEEQFAAAKDLARRYNLPVQDVLKRTKRESVRVQSLMRTQ